MCLTMHSRDATAVEVDRSSVTDHYNQQGGGLAAGPSEQPAESRPLLTSGGGMSSSADDIRSRITKTLSLCRRRGGQSSNGGGPGNLDAEGKGKVDHSFTMREYSLQSSTLL